ncbi:MAG: TonB-dependent receptor plug domain-containing protein [Desulfobacterales bacterium]
MQTQYWRWPKAAIVFFAFCLVSMNAAAAGKAPVQEEEVVVTATMTEKEMQKVPGAVEVIDRREIEALNAQTLDEAIEEAAGLIVTNESGRQKRPSIRGTGSKHTLVLIDGRRLSKGYKDFVDMDQIPVDMIDRIEVIRGPSSALYGSDAIGGVVNIITKHPPETLEAGATVQYGQDTYGEAEMPFGRAYLGNSAGPVGFFLSGSYLDREGWDRDAVLPDDGDEKTLGNIGGRFSYDLNNNHGLAAGFAYNDAETEGGRFLQNLDRERTAEEERLNYFVEYNGKPSPLTQIMLRANHSEHENDIRMSPKTQLTAEEDAERTLDQAEGRFTRVFFDKHVVTLGTEFRAEEREDRTGRDDDVDNLGFYLQDDYQVLDPLHLVLGMRYDDHSDFGSEWTPRTSLIYSLLDNLRVKASYGTGFRAPTISELFVTSYRKRGKWIYEPNPNLAPEESESYEAGIEGEYKACQGKITAFRNEVENLIEPVRYNSTGKGKKKKAYYRYENIAEATLQGIELAYGIGLPRGFTVSGHLTYLDTEDEETGRELEGQPDYKGLLKLGYQNPGAGIRSNIRLNYIGERYYADETEDAYTLVNAYASKQVARHVDIFAGIDNIFNTREASDNVVYVEPTTFYAGVTVTL